MRIVWKIFFNVIIFCLSSNAKAEYDSRIEGPYFLPTWLSNVAFQVSNWTGQTLIKDESMMGHFVSDKILADLKTSRSLPLFKDQLWQANLAEIQRDDIVNIMPLERIHSIDVSHLVYVLMAHEGQPNISVDGPDPIGINELIKKLSPLSTVPLRCAARCVGKVQIDSPRPVSAKRSLMILERALLQAGLRVVRVADSAVVETLGGKGAPGQ